MKGHAEGDRGIVSIDLDNDKPTAPPRFSVGFSRPLGDVSYLWHAGDDGRCPLVPSWLRRFRSDIVFRIRSTLFLTAITVIA